MRKKLTGKFLSMIIAVALLMTLVPLVSAYEAYTTNVKIRVKERFNCSKTVRLATPEEIEESGITFPSEPNPETVDPDYPLEVPTFTCVVWVVRISISNPDDYCYTELVIKDNFSAEVGGEPLDDMPVDVIVRMQTRGNTKKGSFQSQTRIVWYVTCDDWDPVTEECTDNSLELCPGESAYLEMLVWTKLNPSGNKQSYTSPGDYTLNSGPTAKWLDPDGHQVSFDGLPVHITAYD